MKGADTFSAKVYNKYVNKEIVRENMAYLSGNSSLVAELHGGWNTMGEKITFHVKVLCIFNERRNF